MTNNPYSRYYPQVIYHKIGPEGQKKILNTKALIIGCGAVGSAIANSLTRMGVRYLRLVDDDVVEIDNLQRQLLYTEKDTKEKNYKVQACKRALEQINSEVQIQDILDRITEENIGDYTDNIDIIFDGTDNLDVRYIINKTAVKKSIPYIYGAAAGENGSAMLILPQGPCLNCLLQSTISKGETAQSSGILNQITMIVGSIESMIGLRYILDDYQDCLGKLYMVNLWEMTMQSFLVNKDPQCPVCGTG